MTGWYLFIFFHSFSFLTWPLANSHKTQKIISSDRTGLAWSLLPLSPRDVRGPQPQPQPPSSRYRVRCGLGTSLVHTVRTTCTCGGCSSIESALLCSALVYSETAIGFVSATSRFSDASIQSAWQPSPYAAVSRLAPPSVAVNWSFSRWAANYKIRLSSVRLSTCPSRPDLARKASLWT